MFNPPHPGRMIADSLEYLGISAREFARNLGVSLTSITQILNQECPISPEMAVRISAALPGPSASVWLAMQADYDAWSTARSIDSSVKRTVA